MTIRSCLDLVELEVRELADRSYEFPGDDIPVM